LIERYAKANRLAMALSLGGHLEKRPVVTRFEWPFTMGCEERVLDSASEESFQPADL